MSFKAQIEKFQKLDKNSRLNYYFYIKNALDLITGDHVKPNNL